jgi:hypothetical protein
MQKHLTFARDVNVNNSRVPIRGRGQNSGSQGQVTARMPHASCAQAAACRLQLLRLLSRPVAFAEERHPSVVWFLCVDVHLGAANHEVDVR